jgi:hypothetical protein
MRDTRRRFIFIPSPRHFKAALAAAKERHTNPDAFLF